MNQQTLPPTNGTHFSSSPPLSPMSILDTLPGMAYRCRNDANWTMEFVSAGTEALTGYSPDAFIDNRTLAFNDIILEEDRTQVNETVQNALAQRAPYQLTYRIRTADRQIKWVWEQGQGVFHGETIEALEGFITDITPLRQQHNIVGSNVIDTTSQQMQIAADLAQRLTTIRDLDLLLNEVVSQLQRRFDLYHVHIYLLDEAQQQLVMAKGSGSVGDTLRAQNHRIDANHRASLVARAARFKEVVVVPDVREAPDFLPNPLLPKTKTEVAVPLVVAGKVLGVLDIQDNTPNRFSDADLSATQTVAGLVATALQNAELFTQVEENLALTRIRLEVSQALAHANTETDVLDVLFDTIADVAEAQVLSLMVTGPDTDRVATVYRVLTPPERSTTLTPGMALKWNEYSIARLIQGKQTLFYTNNVREDVELNPSARELLQRSNSASVAVITIHAGEQVAAVLTISSEQPNFFDSQKIALYETIAEQGSIAMRTAQLSTQVQQSLTRTTIRLRVNQAVSTAESEDDVAEALFTLATEMVGHGQVTYWKTSGSGDERISTLTKSQTPPEGYHPLPLGLQLNIVNVPMTRELEASDGLFITGNAFTDPRIDEETRALTTQTGNRSFLIVSLHIGDEYYGSLSVASIEENAFDDNAVLLFRTIAERGSLALRAARLRDQVQFSLDQASIRLRVNQAVSTAESEDDVIDALFGLAIEDIHNGQITYWRTSDSGDGKVSTLYRSETPPEGYHALPLGLQIEVAAGGTPFMRVLEEGDGFFLTGNAFTDPRIDDETRALTSQTGNRSFLTVLLRSSDEYYGNLSVGSLEEDAFDDDIVLLFRTIAERGSLALRAARLRDQVQFALDQTNIRLNISQALASVQDEESVLDALIHQAGFILGAHVTLATVDFNDPDLAVITRRSHSFDSTVPPLPVGARFTKEEFPIQKLIQPNVPFVSGDLRDDPRVDDATRMLAMSINATSGAIFPMTESGTIIGWTTVLSHTPHFFDDPATLYLYVSLTEQGTAALTKARLQADHDRAEAERQAYTLQLQTTAQLATRLNTILDLDELLTETVTEMQRRFDLYHVHIYLFDEHTNQLVMAKGSGDVGEALRVSSHAIAYDQPTSLVARAARSKEIVVVPDVTESPDFLPNPLLPDTKTEVAVPLVVAGKVLGVLDIQDDTPNRFGEADLSVAQTVAGLVATSLQNAELFTQVEHNLTLTRVRLDINQALAGATTEADVIEALFQSAAKVTESQVIYSFMAGTGDDRLLTVHKIHTPPTRATSLTPGVVLPVKFYPVMHLVEGPRKTFITNNREEDPNVDEMTKALFRRSNSVSVAIIPIWDGDTLASLITASSDQPDFFDESLAVLYDTIAERGSIALRTARLNDQVEFALQQTRIRLNINQDVGNAQTEEDVLDAMIRQAGFIPGAHVTLATVDFYDPELAVLTRRSDSFDSAVPSLPVGARFTPDAFPIQKLIAPNTPFVSGNLHTDQRVDDATRTLATSINAVSGAIFPLTASGMIIGWVTVLSDQPNFFNDPAKVYLYESLAEQGTAAIAKARLQAERDTADQERQAYNLQLRTTAELATRLNTILDLEELLTETVTEMQSRFDLYHVHIYLLDPRTNQLVMTKGSGEVGEILRSQSHRIDYLHPNSVVARAAQSKEVVLVADVREAPDFLPNPLLPETRTEAAVPLVVAGGRVLGVLDIQDDTPNRFSSTDISVARTVAGLVATSLQNAELFAQVEHSLNETQLRLQVSQALATTHTEKEVKDVLFDLAASVVPKGQVTYWETEGVGDERISTLYRTQAPTDVYNALPTGLRLRWTDVPLGRELDENNGVFITGNAHTDPRLDEGVRKLTTQTGGKSFILVAISVEDEYFGSLAVSSHEENAFDDSIILLYKTIAERGALALRTARLNDQVQFSLQQTNIRFNISQDLNRAQSEDEVLDALIRQAGFITGAHVTLATVDFNDPDHAVFTQRSDGFNSAIPPFPSGLRFTADAFPIQKLITPHQPFITGDLRTDPQVDDATRMLALSMNAVSGGIFPFTERDTIIGWATVLAPEPNFFDDPAKVYLYDSLTEQGAAALVKARLQADRDAANAQVARQLRETQIRLAVAEALSLATTEDEILDVIVQRGGLYRDALLAVALWVPGMQETVEIVRCDPYESGVLPYPTNVRYAAHEFPFISVLSATDTFITANMQVDERATPASHAIAHALGIVASAIIPMTVSGDWLGGLVLTSPEEGYFTEDKLYFYQALAELSAEAIVRARLRGAAERERALLNGVINSLPSGVIVLDPEGNTLLVNQRIAEATDAAARGQNIILHHLSTGEVVQESELPLNRTLASRDYTSDYEVFYDGPDGNKVYVLANAAPVLDQHREFMGAVGTYTDITTQKEAEQALRVSTQQLQTAAELAGRINTILDLEELLTETVSELQQQFDLYHVHIYLQDYDNNSLVMLKGSGPVGETLRERNHSISIDQERSLVARAARSQQIIVVDDVTKAPDFLPNPLLPDTRSEAAIPLTTGGRTIGVLDVQDDQVNRFSATELSVLQTLGGLIASTLQNANLFEQVAQNLRETRLRLQVSQALAVARGEREVVDVIFEQASSIGNAQVTYFTVTGEGDSRSVTVDRVYAPSENARTLPVGLKLRWQDIPIGELMESGEKVFVTGNALTDERIGEGLRNVHRTTGVLSYIALPIGDERQIYSFITAASPQENAFDENTINLYQTIADRGSLALREGRLYDQVELSLKQTNIRFEVSQALAQAQTEEGVLDAMIRQAGFVSGAHVTIATVDLDDTELAVITRRSDAFDSAVPAMPLGARFTKTEFPIQGLITPDAPFISGDLANDTRVDDATRMLAQGLGVKSGGIFPLTDAGKIVGWVTVLSDQLNFFDDPAKVYLYESMAEQGTVALRAARLFDETQETAIRLKELDRLKSEFLANMSHELRTPLNSIIGYAEIMLMGINGPLDDDNVEDVQAIRNSGQHLLRLINDILDLAKIEAGRMTLDLDTVNVAALLEEIRLAHAALVHKKDVELTVSVEPDTLTVTADRLRLSQVLTNLVSNAVKFTEKGHVRVHASRERDWIRIDVADTGVGIASENLEAIFEEFRQADGSSTRRAEGTGLGLAISRRLIQMHGGVITVESEIDKGSMFTIYLPVVPNPHLN